MGSGIEAHLEQAEPLGEWLARQNVHLLTGGGGGVMASISRAFYQVPGRQGLVIGVIPGTATKTGYTPHSGYPNPWVELPIYTHLPLSGPQGADPLSRNHINILSSDVIIALPGAAGTASEVALALRYGRPLVAYLKHREEIKGLPAGALVEPNFERVKAFVLKRIAIQKA
jgi:uncharacterized protein (TIGR00725 family)